MNYEQLAGDLPREGRIKFSSAEENEETMRRLGVRQELRQLESGAFRCDLMARGAGDIELYADRFKNAFTMTLEPPDGTIGLLFLRNMSGDLVASGDKHACNKLFVLPCGSGIDITAAGLTPSESITLPVQRFDEMTETLCPGAKGVGFNELGTAHGEIADRRRMAEAILHGLAVPETEATPEYFSNLSATVVAWIAEASPNRQADIVSLDSRKHQIARRARAYLEDHYPRPILMEEVCRELGVGVRTLQRCFLEYFQLSPSRYLKALRYDRARRTLMTARPESTSVTAIALEHGFNHFGRFSVEYRKLFGESPRETLTNPPSIEHSNPAQLALGD